MKTLSLLGSTGSIGMNVLAVVRQFPDRFCVAGLSAGRRIDLLAEPTRLPMHFFAFYPVDRSIEVGIGERGFQRSFLLIPFGQFPLQLLDFPEQRPPLRE